MSAQRRRPGPRAGASPRRFFEPSARTAGLAVVAAGTTALTAGMAATTVCDGLDGAVFRVVNTLPDGLFRPMWLLQLPGVLGAPGIVALAAVLLRRYRLAAGLLILIPAKLVVERDVLKTLVHRPRPAVTMSDPVLRDVPAAGLSFPSGHAIILFGIATLVAPYLGRGWRRAVFAFAALAALARVYLGAHAPLDVVGGAAAGVLLGAVITLALGIRDPRAAARTRFGPRLVRGDRIRTHGVRDDDNRHHIHNTAVHSTGTGGGGVE